MKMSSVVLLILLGLIGAFTVFNWGALMAPAQLSLGFADFQAPLGLVMLGLMAGLVAVVMAYVVYLQSAMLLEARRHARELRENRELADKAEASRFTDLKNHLDGLLKAKSEADKSAQASLLSRLDRLDADLRGRMSEAENGLLANIGELDDRIEKLLRQ